MFQHTVTSNPAFFKEITICSICSILFVSSSKFTLENPMGSPAPNLSWRMSNILAPTSAKKVVMWASEPGISLRLSVIYKNLPDVDIPLLIILEIILISIFPPETIKTFFLLL